MQLNQQITQEQQAHYNFLQERALWCRNNIIDMHTRAQNSHMASGLSVIDILTVLYHCVVNPTFIKNEDPNRDFVILSKGHAASAMYAALSSVGIINPELLKTYYQNGSELVNLAARNTKIGIEASTGSLGHGLSMGVGLALAAKHDNRPSKIYVILGDGECQEGSIWEALICAERFKLNNLIIIVDYNNLQALDRVSDIMTGSFTEKFKAFGCHTQECNGHNHQELLTCFDNCKNNLTPSAIIAHTLKGKGISFVQDRIEWHYKSLNQEQYQRAKQELGAPCETVL